MSEYQDWNITLAFPVPPGDFEGEMTEAIFEAALEHAPSQAEGLIAQADTVQGKVWILFTLVNASRGLAEDIARDMKLRVRDAVPSADDVCVISS